MSFCEKCGTKLVDKDCGIDGKAPYCENCGEFRFPTFSSAISAVVMNSDHSRILLIQQYGRRDNILIAGYISKGENARQTLVREIKEETGLNVIKYYYNDNEYFEPTNTLMHNYVAICDSENFQLTNEVDKAQWFTPQEALKAIKPNSLASHFLEKAVKNIISGL